MTNFTTNTDGTFTITENCGKCNGTGVVYWAVHVDNGRCFRCHGRGVFTKTVKTHPDVLAKRREQAAERRRAKIEERVAAANERIAAREAKYANDPRIGTYHRAHMANFPAVATETYETLERIDAGDLDAPWLLEKFARNLDPKAPVVEGRIEVRGKVVSTKSEPNPFAFGTVYKMLVLDDRGFKVWGTIPSKIFEVGIGDRVAFTANVEASRKDECFGFYKRPAKPVILEEAA